MQQIPSLKKRDPNKLATTTYANEIATALEGMFHLPTTGANKDFPLALRSQHVRIESNADGLGKYIGKSIVGNIIGDATSDLEALSGAVDEFSCIIYNLRELNTGTHRLAPQLLLIGLLIGTERIPDGDSYRYGRPIFIVDSGPRVLVPVKIYAAGGGNGTASTPASYLYDVTDMDGATLGISLPVTRPRENGPVTQQPDGSYGLGFSGTNFDDDFVLWDAGEIYETVECT